jgi:hypothetical protein
MSAKSGVALVAVVLGWQTLCCGGGVSDGARYPAREPGCAVKKYPGEAPIPVDDLGMVTAECSEEGGCERRLLDEACKRGANVVWGLGDNALTATKVGAHAAHTLRATKGPRERGCAVQVFADAPPMPTENIGPVTAFCAETDSREVCSRELEDQACLLGGDVLWQLEGPTPVASQTGMRQRMRGRAAHTK